MDSRKILAEIDKLRANLDAFQAAIVSEGCAPRSLGERPQTIAARDRASTLTARAYEDAIRTLETFTEEPLSFRFLLESSDAGRRALSRALAQAIQEGRVLKVAGGFVIAPPTPLDAK